MATATQISTGGPVEQYLQASGRNRDDFDAMLRQEDEAALSLVVAEQVWAALDTLGRTIEAQRATKPAVAQPAPSHSALSQSPT